MKIPHRYPHTTAAWLRGIGVSGYGIATTLSRLPNPIFYAARRRARCFVFVFSVQPAARRTS